MIFETCEGSGSEGPHEAGGVFGFAGRNRRALLRAKDATALVARRQVNARVEDGSGPTRAADRPRAAGQPAAGTWVSSDFAKGGKLSLRAVSAEMAKQGFPNERGHPFNHKSGCDHARVVRPVRCRKISGCLNRRARERRENQRE